jgi:antitoxin (DNA-binding transcriptional repressor) of toxin-antitoxin stability system
MFAMNPNLRGTISEMAIAFEAVQLGVEVFKPLSEHSRCDLIFGIADRLYRVQCKSARLAGDVLQINLVSSWHTPQGYVRNKYSEAEVDLVAAHCHELRRNYLIPFDRVEERKSGIHLRLTPPKNGQRASIHYAAEYELPGAVAQLGERRRGTPKATGSSPVSSTHPPDRDGSEITVGAHEFRGKLGFWMQRVAAGDEIVITRRGRRYARLGRPDPQLATTDTGQAEQQEGDPAASPPDTARTSRWVPRVPPLLP